MKKSLLKYCIVLCVLLAGGLMRVQAQPVSDFVFFSHGAFSPLMHPSQIHSSAAQRAESSEIIFEENEDERAFGKKFGPERLLILFRILDQPRAINSKSIDANGFAAACNTIGFTSFDSLNIAFRVFRI